MFVETCRELTWGQLSEWASRPAVERGLRIRKEGAVSSLMTIRGGEGLLAWVEAEEPFATLIEQAGKEFSASCSCNPLNYPCEHAVAVIIEYIAHLQRSLPIPAAPRNDPRFYLV
jgi:uncharacterized Zn finger protein